MNMLSPNPHDTGAPLDNYGAQSNSQHTTEVLAQEAPALAAALGILSDFLQKGTCKPTELTVILRDLHETCLAAMREECRAGKEDEIGTGGRASTSSPIQSRISPAVPIEDSVTDDFIICLEDGKRVKVLSRYLRSYYGMTMEEYRLRWNLPDDYPAVPPALSRRRAEIARENKPHFNRANISRARATADVSSGASRNDFSENNTTTPAVEEMPG